MSEKNVVAFAHKLEGNETLQNQVKSLTPGDTAGVVKLAAEVGLDFTVEELQTVFARSGELSEAQLDQVAGGVSEIGTPPIQINLLSHIVQPGSHITVRKAGEHPLDY